MLNKSSPQRPQNQNTITLTTKVCFSYLVKWIDISTTYESGRSPSAIDLRTTLQPLIMYNELLFIEKCALFQ